MNHDYFIDAAPDAHLLSERRLVRQLVLMIILMLVLAAALGFAAGYLTHQHHQDELQRQEVGLL